MENRDSNQIKKSSSLIDKGSIEALNATISKAWIYSRSIIDASPDPFATIGLNGKITDVNYAGEHATGLPREKIIGTDFSEYFTEPKKAQAIYQQVLKDGKAVGYELNFKHISGYTIPVLYNASVYKDDEGQIIGVLATARDFTATRRSEKYTRSLIEASLDPFVTIGPGGVITDVNYATEQATGLPREKIIGTDFSEYFTEPGKAQAVYQQVLKDGKVVDYELNLKHISGSSIFVLYNASVLKDDEGQIIGVFAAARDFTATRRAEKYSRSLIEANLDQLIIIGRDGKITDVNYANEQATGLPREKLIGTDFSGYVTEPDKAQAGFQQVLKDGKVFDYELNLKHISGYNIPVLYNASVYKDDEGQIVGVLAVARDISAIKKYENKLINLNNNLESANKELETFSYSVSHDLKAPLRHITGYLSLLVKKYIALLPEEGRHYLDNISYSAKNMEELIDGLLQFLITGKTEMNQKLLDMNEIVDALIKPYREQDQQHRIEFQINPLPSAFGDLEMIKSVWNNLIENALKFSKKKDLAKISIGAEKNETEIIYYIKDNGTGFDMNYASKLFAVFQRLHSREDYDGVGIGLATIQRIITRHGGRIWAEGKVGEGAAFYFTLMKRKKDE